MEKTRSLALLCFMVLATASCGRTPVKELPPKVLTVERCYEYKDFTTDQWNEAINWLQNEPAASVPALMVEDYIRLREINECKDAKDHE